METNTMSLEGRVSFEPKVKHFDDEKVVAYFSIVTQQDNKYIWNSVVCLNDLAKVVKQTVSKGCKVYVEGRIHTRTYTDSQGVEKSIDDIVASKIEILREDTPIYFYSMSGVGTISCYDCGYSEEIISFIHGSSIHYFTNSGLQCHSCGKFHAIKNWKSSDEALCECGGLLEREESIFCPKCKSKEVNYKMKYMT